MTVLGIETSCDETSAAIIIDGEIKSNIISSHLVHSQFGGVVPELASRAHQQLVIPVVANALQEAGIAKNNIDGIAVTYGPGLMGALLVGVNFAKAFAYGINVPLVGVNHMEAHLYSNFIEEPRPAYPFLCLIVSGGHTQLVLVHEEFHHELLGETLDDAAGEAFDKVAKMLGLGFPGGPLIDKLARDGDPDFVKFPRSFLDGDSFDFSFSGIKTAVLYWLREHSNNGKKRSQGEMSNICASFQTAVVDVLVGKLQAAVMRFHVQDVAVAGGVSANSELRRRMADLARRKEFRLFIPKFEYCTDNGAMVAYVGYRRMLRNMRSSMELQVVPNLSL